MREFRTCHDYKHFARSVKRHSRYVFESDAEEFLLTVQETGLKRIDAMPAGYILHRAQFGFEWEAHPVDPRKPDGEMIEYEGPFSMDRMKPPRDSAREGRVNPKGIPCLYLATEKTTAMAETRPWLTSYISLAQFKTTRDMKIVNCSDPKQYFDPFYIGRHRPESQSPEEREKAVWGEIGYAFSEPVLPSDSTADYAPTQILAEAFRRAGCDGISYKSSLGTGYSLALFDLDSAVGINCRLHQTAAVSFDFKEAGNLYVVPEHYPELKLGS